MSSLQSAARYHSLLMYSYFPIYALHRSVFPLFKRAATPPYHPNPIPIAQVAAFPDRPGTLYLPSFLACCCA